MKKQLQQGFTLIELMIVVAIIGILASIALPAYQTYVAKSNVTSIQASAAAGKTAIWQFYIDNGVMPADADALKGDDDTKGLEAIMTSGLPGGSVGTYTKVSDTSGKFTVKLAGINGNINGKNVTFTYTDTGGALEFTCVADNGVSTQYLPKLCTVAAS